MAKKTSSLNESSKVVAAARAWQKLPLPKFSSAPAAAEVSRLLALLNGAEVVAAGRVWRCRARQLFSVAKDQEDVPAAGWWLLFSLGGTPLLCRTELPSGFRGGLESMSKPYRLEELPASVALGLLSLALSPLLQELFAAKCRLVEHNIGGAKKAAVKEEIVLRIDALPVTQKDKNESSEESLEESSEESLLEPVRLHCHLAASALDVVVRSLRVKQRTRSYPPNLYTTWQCDVGETSLSVEEFRALKEGDVLLLS